MGGHRHVRDSQPEPNDRRVRLSPSPLRRTNMHVKEQLQHKVPNDVFVSPSELKEISVNEVLTHPLTTKAFHLERGVCVD